nr:hypothetical protein Iba_chr07dCG1310 [Ipomoea batatas]
MIDVSTKVEVLKLRQVPNLWRDVETSEAGKRSKIEVVKSTREISIRKIDLRNSSTSIADNAPPITKVFKICEQTNFRWNTATEGIVCKPQKCELGPIGDEMGRRSLRLDRLLMLGDKGPENSLKERSRHSSFFKFVNNYSGIDPFKQEPYLLKVSNLMRNNTTQIVAIKVEVLKLSQVPNLMRNNSTNEVYTKVEVLKLRQIPNLWRLDSDHESSGKENPLNTERPLFHFRRASASVVVDAIVSNGKKQGITRKMMSGA